MADAQNRTYGEYGLQHLRCTPGQEANFWPIWDARNAATDAGNHAEEIRLTGEMRQYQSVIGEETFPNIVTDNGSKDLLDRFFKGAAYTQTIRMGLKGTGTAAVSDTQGAHATWLEQGGANAPTYSGNRKDVTMNVASGTGAGARSSASPTQAFAITGTGTVFGCFINNGGAATKDDTTGILFSAGDFGGGSRAVINGDTLNATYTLTL